MRGAGGVFMSITSTGGASVARTPRIPKAEITGLYGFVPKRLSRKLFGEVPEPAEVMWHNRAVQSSVMGFGRKAQKWDQLDPDLQSFALAQPSAGYATSA
jgi:hypothetical protein